MTCNCGKQLDATDPHTDAVHDDHKGAYYCDIQCFRDWAEDNLDAVIEFYERMNVT